MGFAEEIHLRALAVPALTYRRDRTLSAVGTGKTDIGRMAEISL